MGLNRMMMMKNGEDLKNIKAMMTVGYKSSKRGFQNGQFGSLSPNPLPNGILVTNCYIDALNYFSIKPSSIKSCTINNITVKDSAGGSVLASYFKKNDGKTIPVIFHF